jgi:hypothetical protein
MPEDTAMKSKPRRAGRGQSEFSAEEHLAIQRQIERRAYELSQARESRPGAELDDWLRAENEVIAEFCHARQKQSA